MIGEPWNFLLSRRLRWLSPRGEAFALSKVWRRSSGARLMEGRGRLSWRGAAAQCGQGGEGRAEAAASALEAGGWILRSLGLMDAPLSLVVDDRGIHSDATKPSRLEALVPRTLSSEETVRAQALLDLWREARVSQSLPRHFTIPSRG